MKKVKETGKKQTMKICLQMFAMLMLLPTIMIYAQSVKIPDGWSDRYAYVNGIRFIITMQSRHRASLQW